MATVRSKLAVAASVTLMCLLGLGAMALVCGTEYAAHPAIWVGVFVVGWLVHFCFKNVPRELLLYDDRVVVARGRTTQSVGLTQILRKRRQGLWFAVYEHVGGAFAVDLSQPDGVRCEQQLDALLSRAEPGNRGCEACSGGPG